MILKASQDSNKNQREAKREQVCGFIYINLFFYFLVIEIAYNGLQHVVHDVVTNNAL